MTDEEVVEAVKRGSVDTYGEIVERYQGPIGGYIRKMINQSTEEVEDLTQEVLILAFENINGYEKGNKFSSWLYRIAHNKAVDYFKKKKLKITQIEDKEELLAGNELLFEDLEIQKETKEQMWQAINKLDVKYKEVIVLSYFEERNYEEISDILKIPTSNVGVLLFRAKKQLKQKLNPPALRAPSLDKEGKTKYEKRNFE